MHRRSLQNYYYLIYANSTHDNANSTPCIFHIDVLLSHKWERSVGPSVKNVDGFYTCQMNCVEFAMCCAAFAMICVEFVLIRYILYFYNNCKKVYYNIEFEITVDVYLIDNCDAAMCQS